MKLWVSRYWSDSKNYEIMCYESREMAETNPHDYLLSFSKSQWRKMKCRVPKGKYPATDYSSPDEIMAVDLIAKEKV